MLCHVNVTDDVVVDLSVFPGAEVPGLLLGEVWSLLKPLHLVLEIDNVESLLVSQSSVL